MAFEFSAVTSPPGNVAIEPLRVSTPTMHFITCEYTPQVGGVADFTRGLAANLSAHGVPTHVWAPGTEGTSIGADGVVVHRELGTFSRRDLARARALLQSHQAGGRLLLQWVPHGFGQRAMNVHVVLWFRQLVRQDRFSGDVMVHEPFLPFRGQTWLVKTVSLVQRWMTRAVVRTASTIFVSTTAWVPRLASLCKRGTPFTLLPVSSPVPVQDDALDQSVLWASSAKSSTDGPVLGHFGKYGDGTWQLTAQLIARTAELRPEVRFILMGQGSDDARVRLCANAPDLTTRIIATGTTDHATLSRHLQACHIMLQPYADGATARRTTLMAALSHGIATVTTDGELTEALWRESQAVLLCRAGDVAALLRAVQELIDVPQRRSALAERGRQFYIDRFTHDVGRRTLLPQHGARYISETT